MHKLVILEKIDDKYIQEIKKVIPEWQIIELQEPFDDKMIEDAEILLGWDKRAIKNCLHDCTSLKWVQVWSAGVNGMPFDEFKKYGIILTNASGVHSIPIAETVFGMMLAFTRKINAYIRNQMNKKWDRSYNGGELFGKTIGILGVGAIGREIAKLAKAYNMSTLGFRHSGKPTDYIDVMYSKDNVTELFELSDYVVNTLPLTNDTFHIINKSCFFAMKPSAYYFNVGRGATHDEAALIEALKNGQIAGAGLDVFETEPLPIDSPLWDMDNVIITPHTAGNSDRYAERVIKNIFLPNLLAYISGSKELINQVDLDKQY